MSLDIAIDGQAILYPVQPESIEAATRAELGSAVFGKFIVEDATGACAIPAHRLVTLSETSCSQPRLFTGWTAARNIGRDDENALITGEARLINVTIVDLNALFGFRIIHGTDGNRPAETWTERLTWLLGSDYLSGLITDTGYVASHGATMEATDYRGQYPAAVCQDLVARRGVGYYNYFAFWDQVANTVGLFFDQQEEAVNNSPLAISNDLADVDGITTFAPSSDATLLTDPEDTWSEVIVRYKNGSVYRSRPGTADDYIRRGTTIERPYTGAATTAQTQAERFLDDHANEIDRITVTINVPPEAAGLVTSGQRINVKFTHLAGYQAVTSMRIVSCTARPIDNTATRYALTLELANGRPARTATAGFQTLTVQALGDGAHVIAYANTYGETGEGEGGRNYYGTFVQQSVTLLGGHWYRTYFELTGTCYPDGGGCYAMGSGVYVGTYDPGQWDSEPPVARIAAIALPYTDLYRTGFVGPGTGSYDPAQGWTSEGDPPHAAEGVSVSAYLGVQLNTAGSTVSTANVWIEDLGLGDDTGPYATPPPPLTPWDGTTADTTGIIPLAPDATVTYPTDPTVNDDANDGYVVGNQWVSSATGRRFVLTDATVGAAVWVPMDGLTVSSLCFVIDGGGSAITTGVKGDVEIPFNFEITAGRLFADQVGSVTVDLWTDAYGNFPPTDADSITASAPLQITAGNAKSEDLTLTGWTTTGIAGTILRYNVDAAATITRLSVCLTMTRSA